MPVSPEKQPPLLRGATQLRLATADDHPALVALHRQAYGSGWSRERWLHRYEAGPLGSGVVYGAFAAEGACVAMCCGVMLPAKVKGAVAKVCRGGDVAVHPDLQATAAGPRLLLRVCRGFVDEVGRSGAAMIYGFPEHGLTRTLVRHCGYEALGDVLWLARDLGAVAADGGYTVRDTDHMPCDAASIYREHTDNGVERTAAYLQWRYHDGSDRPYRFLTARGSLGVAGAAVVRHDPAHAAMVVHELCVPAGGRGAASSLLSAAVEIARERGCRQLVTTCSGHSAWFAQLQAAHGFRVVVSPYQFLFRSYSRTLTRPFLQGHWDLSPGDLDFA